MDMDTQPTPPPPPLGTSKSPTVPNRTTTLRPDHTTRQRKKMTKNQVACWNKSIFSNTAAKPITDVYAGYRRRSDPVWRKHNHHHRISSSLFHFAWNCLRMGHKSPVSGSGWHLDSHFSCGFTYFIIYFDTLHFIALQHKLLISTQQSSHPGENHLSLTCCLLRLLIIVLLLLLHTLCRNRERVVVWNTMGSARRLGFVVELKQLLLLQNAKEKAYETLCVDIDDLNHAT